MGEVTLGLKAAEDLAADALARHRTGAENAREVARALVAAEVDGQRGHGLSRVPSYAAQAASGKVDGFAVPRAAPVGAAALRVDAGHGFAYPALSLAVERLVGLTPEAGVAAAAVFNSHHCGVAGHHAERLAEHGLIGLVFANSPKAIAPWGGTGALYGTNPIAFAAPRRDAAPLVVDLSLSKVARGKIMVAGKEGRAIPEGWALDAEGRPTTDPEAALAGSMVPMGDAKGAALALVVETLSAALTGSHMGFEASSFFTAEGDPPGVGQFLLAFAPGPLSGDRFGERIETLVGAILGQPGTRLPGTRRLDNRARAEAEGITVPEALHKELVSLAE